MKRYREPRIMVFLAVAGALLVMSSCQPQTSSSTGTSASQTTTASSQPSGSSETTQATTAPTTQATTQATTQPTTSPTTSATTGKPVTYKIEDAYPNLTFQQPLFFGIAPDQTANCFVLERSGRIRIFEDRPDISAAGVFLDLSALVDTGSQEKGLLGLAFHPDYLTNGYLYVNYTNTSSTVIARYTRQGGNPAVADPASAAVLLTFAQPYANHNGGCLAFGPDRYLYIAAGDGGSAGDPQNNAQNLTNLLGKILRIDINTTQRTLPYGIPNDNPFYGNTQNYRAEIYAYGLRNPWRFSFDDQGRLWAGDVGQDRMEEIDLINKGQNYGWAAFEGTLTYKTIPGVDTSSMVMPIWEYDHSLGIAVTGGYVYAGSELPGLVGKYLYGDYGSGRIWSLWMDSSQNVHIELLLDTSLNISSFGVDSAGEIRIVDLRGKIYRLRASA